MASVPIETRGREGTNENVGLVAEVSDVSEVSPVSDDFSSYHHRLISIRMWEGRDEDEQGRVTSRSSIRILYPSLLNLETSKCEIVSRPLARRMSSGRLSPRGSWIVPLPSMILHIVGSQSSLPQGQIGSTTHAIVLSLLNRISSVERDESARGHGEEERRRTRSKVSIRSSSLDLGHLLFLQSELTVDTRRVRSNRQRSHSEAANIRTLVSVEGDEGSGDVRVVRDSSVRRGGLSSRERLPPGRSTRSSVGCV